MSVPSHCVKLPQQYFRAGSAENAAIIERILGNRPAAHQPIAPFRLKPRHPRGGHIRGKSGIFLVRSASPGAK